MTVSDNLRNWMSLLVSESLAPEHWASVCTSLLLSMNSESEASRDAFSRLERLVALGAMRKDPLGVRCLELVQTYVGPTIAELPTGCATRWERPVAIPRWAEHNGAFALSTPAEARVALQIDRDNPALAVLAAAVRRYLPTAPSARVKPLGKSEKIHSGRHFVCGVQPYIDTILATVAMYIVSDLLEDITMEFTPVGWTKVPRHANQGDLHLSYGPRTAFRPEQYHFQPTKHDASRMPCLRNIRRTTTSEYRATPEGLSFIGSYSMSGTKQEHQGIIRVRYGELSETNPPARVDAHSVDPIQGATEIQTLLALAAGELSVNYVVPTNAGFLWCAATGLLYQRLGPGLEVGSLEWGEVIMERNDDVVGFAVLGTHKYASDLGNQLSQVVKRISATIHKSTSSSDATAVDLARVLGALKAPIMRAYDDDSGVLSGLPTRLALEMAHEAGELYERELEYQPPWWSVLRNSLPAVSENSR